MRLIDPEYGDNPGNKASHCAAKIAEYYYKYLDQKGTQFIFSDLSTYKPDQWNIYSEIRRKLVEDHNIPEKQIKFIQEANSDNARKELFKDMNSGASVSFSVPHRNWERVSTRRNVPWPSIIWTYPEGRPIWSSATDAR